MILYIYRDGFCDPARKVGTIMQFGDSKSLDDFVDGFAASATPKSLLSKRFRAFVTNDDVDVQEVDHYVLFDENLKTSTKPRIKELDLYTRGVEVNETMAAIVKKREEIAAARRH